MSACQYKNCGNAGMYRRFNADLQKKNFIFCEHCFKNFIECSSCMGMTESSENCDKCLLKNNFTFFDAPKLDFFLANKIAKAEDRLLIRNFKKPENNC